MSSAPPRGRVAALVPAAGKGERLGPGAPKALREIAGTPMLVHAVKALAASPMVEVVIVAAPDASVEEVRSLLAQQDFSADVSVVAGGDSRSESVARALIALPDDVDGCSCTMLRARSFPWKLSPESPMQFVMDTTQSFR